MWEVVDLMYGQYHSLPPEPPKEKYLLGLNAFEACWIVAGTLISYRLLQIVPPLPTSDFIFRKIHAFIPLFIAAFFAFGKHPKTGLSLLADTINLLEFKARNRTLLYKRGKY
jgi:hypothetical protein